MTCTVCGSNNLAGGECKACGCPVILPDPIRVCAPPPAPLKPGRWRPVISPAPIRAYGSDFLVRGKGEAIVSPVILPDPIRPKRDLKFYVLSLLLLIFSSFLFYVIYNYRGNNPPPHKELPKNYTVDIVHNRSILNDKLNFFRSQANKTTTVNEWISLIKQLKEWKESSIFPEDGNIGLLAENLIMEFHKEYVGAQIIVFLQKGKNTTAVKDWEELLKQLKAWKYSLDDRNIVNNDKLVTELIADFQAKTTMAKLQTLRGRVDQAKTIYDWAILGDELDMWISSNEIPKGSAPEKWIIEQKEFIQKNFDNLINLSNLEKYNILPHYNYKDKIKAPIPNDGKRIIIGKNIDTYQVKEINSSYKKIESVIVSDDKCYVVLKTSDGITEKIIIPENIKKSLNTLSVGQCIYFDVHEGVTNVNLINNVSHKSSQGFAVNKKNNLPVLPVFKVTIKKEKRVGFVNKFREKDRIIKKYGFVFFRQKVQEPYKEEFTYYETISVLDKDIPPEFIRIDNIKHWDRVDYENVKWNEIDYSFVDWKNIDWARFDYNLISNWESVDVGLVGIDNNRLIMASNSLWFPINTILKKDDNPATSSKVDSCVWYPLKSIKDWDSIAFDMVDVKLTNMMWPAKWPSLQDKNMENIWFRVHYPSVIDCKRLNQGGANLAIADRWALHYPVWISEKLDKFLEKYPPQYKYRNEPLMNRVAELCAQLNKQQIINEQAFRPMTRKEETLIGGDLKGDKSSWNTIPDNDIVDRIIYAPSSLTHLLWIEKHKL